MHKSGNQYSKIKQENSLSSSGFLLLPAASICYLSFSLSALPEIAEIALHQFGLEKGGFCQGELIQFGERSSDGGD